MSVLGRTEKGDMKIITAEAIIPALQKQQTRYSTTQTSFNL